MTGRKVATAALYAAIALSAMIFGRLLLLTFVPMAVAACVMSLSVQEDMCCGLITVVVVALLGLLMCGVSGLSLSVLFIACPYAVFSGFAERFGKWKLAYRLAYCVVISLIACLIFAVFAEMFYDLDVGKYFALVLATMACLLFCFDAAIFWFKKMLENLVKR